MRLHEKANSRQNKRNKKSTESRGDGSRSHGTSKTDAPAKSEAPATDYLKYKEDGYNPKEQTEDYFWNTMNSNYISPWPRIQI